MEMPELVKGKNNNNKNNQIWIRSLEEIREMDLVQRRLRSVVLSAVGVYIMLLRDL